MDERISIGSNCLDGTNLDKTFLIFKDYVAPGDAHTTYVPMKDILEKYDINKNSNFVGVRLPWAEKHPDVVMSIDTDADRYMGDTDFILHWYKLSNLLWRIHRLLEASIVNDKQRKALAGLITSEFFHMKEEYDNSVNN